MPKVSVLIPIYGVELFIEKCSRSLFEQTLDDIEYIFVNDATLDNSIEILQRVLNDYPQRKSQVRIINHECNKGLPSARITGIETATGDYIIHCDSDDWVELDMYEQMYLKAIEDDSDIVVCDFVHEYGDRQIIVNSSFISSNPQEVVKYIYKKEFHGYLWSKLFHRRLYKDNNILPIPGANMWEDLGLSIRLFMCANKISVISEVFYHYNRENENSITIADSRKQKSLEERKKNIDVAVDFILEKGGQDYTLTANYLRFSAKSLLLTLERYSEWRKLYKSSNIYIMKYTNIHIRYRILYMLASYGLYFPLRWYKSLKKKLQ